MKRNIFWGLGALLAIMLINACSDPTLVGGGLLDEDRAEVGFTDTFTLQVATELSDPLMTYSPFPVLQADRFLFGDFRDPVFGQAKSTINVQLVPPRTNSAPVFHPNFADITGVDSVVLILPYTSGGFYGKTEGETFGIRVTELVEVFNEDREYFSDHEAGIASAPLAEREFVATLDSISYTDYLDIGSLADPAELDTVSFPHLRIPLPTVWADSLISIYLADTTVFDESNRFLERFPGFQLEPTVPTEGMLAFTLQSVRAGVHIYYRDSTDSPRDYQLVFSNSQLDPIVQFTTFEHNYEDTDAVEFLENGEENDSLLFVQGMAGLRSRIKLPDLSVFENVAINQAFLDFYVARGESLDTANYPLARQIAVKTENDAGEEVFISDMIFADNAQVPFASGFGGVPEFIESQGAIRYRMAVSTYLQEVLEGTMSDEFYLIPIENNDLTDAKRSEVAERVLFYGAGHPQFPVTLSVTFTRL
jgi:hypothetical protein